MQCDLSVIGYFRTGPCGFFSLSNLTGVMNIIVHIDGKRIKELREEQGLTQLYLATVVGVTTDTISRWENRRYPTIKKENGLKLAEALGVDLEEICAGEEKKESGGESGPKVSGPASRSFSWKSWILPALSALVVLVVAGIWQGRPGRPPSFQAVRTLPPHAAPGMSFPVVITLTGSTADPVSVLLRDELSCDCETYVSEGGRMKKSFGSKPRWIGKIGGETAVFAYMVRVGRTMHDRDRITFGGDFVTGKNSGAGKMISGDSGVDIAPFHWADSDRDHTISDEEILMVYEKFSAAEKSGLNLDTVEELWLAGRYLWNRERLAFETGDGPNQ